MFFLKEKKLVYKQNPKYICAEHRHDEKSQNQFIFEY